MINRLICPIVLLVVTVIFDVSSKFTDPAVKSAVEVLEILTKDKIGTVTYCQRPTSVEGRLIRGRKEAIADEAEKVVGGTEAIAGEFPYQISLRTYDFHICGGSLISDQHVLTAGHCVADLKPPYTHVTVVTASNRISAGGEIHKVKRIVSHSEFYNTMEDHLKNDIAIITLAAPYTDNAYQKPIAISTVDPPSMSELTLTGWGRLSAQGPTPDVLQKATLYALTNEECEAYLNGGTKLVDTQICSISRPGVGACPGDSGGPLVYQGKLVGIVSWVYPCAHGLPDVYTRANRYMHFIITAIAKK